jgi:DNA-directed RNA polymerase subunit RPC12/RpoP
MAVSKRLRYEVLRRDSFSCTYCGAKAPDVELHVDHVIPEALGGGDDPDNLTAACIDCNAGKSSTSPDDATVAEVDERSIQWKAAIDRAAEIERDKRKGSDEVVSAFYSDWTDVFADDYFLDHDWQGSAARFHEVGLSRDDMRHAMSVLRRRMSTITHGHFSYFCGVCWKMVSDRRELAAKLVEEQAV